MNDYIKRENAIEAAIEAVDSWDCNPLVSRENLIRCYINEAPADDVRENVRGMWKHIGGDEWGNTASGTGGQSMTTNGRTGLNCPMQHDKVGRCDLTDCPYKDRPTCFTPENGQGAQGDAFAAVFQFGLQQGVLMTCDHADLTSVVRCKDCAFCTEPGCTILCKRFDAPRQVLPDDYCSYGRRKEQPCRSG